MAADVADILYSDATDAPGLDDGLGDPADPRGTPPTRPRRKSMGGTSRRRARTGAAATGGAAIGARELALMIKQVIGGLSIACALALDVDEIAMSGEEAQAIARPLSRILLKSSMAGQVLALANKGGDWAALGWASLMYAIRIYPLIIQRQEMLQAQRANRANTFGGIHVASRPHAGVPPTQPTAPEHRARPDSGPDAEQGGGVNPYSDAAIASALATVAGAGYADPDALAGGNYTNIGAITGAYPAN